MDVCILQYKSANHNYESVWSNKDLAINEALFLIVETILLIWKAPHCTPSQFRDAAEINNLIQQNKLEDALDFWNTCGSNTLSSSWFQFKTLLKTVETASVATLSASRLNLAVNGSANATTTTTAIPVATPINIVMASPKPATPVQYGAVCRKCNQKNDYALADKSDGTYICRSCKMLMDVFSK